MAATTRYGTCSNKTHCSLAFNREAIAVPTDGACPECGRPLKVNGMGSKILRWLMLLIVLGGLVAGGWYVKKTYFDTGHFDLVAYLKSWWPASPGSSPGASPSNKTTGTADPAAQETPGPTAGPVKSPDFKIANENAKARDDVLKRVNQMPHLTDQQKDQLRDAVRNARNMGCIFVIPFPNGRTELNPNEMDLLTSGFQSAAIQRLINDPTVVFVVLGYADKQGDTGNKDKNAAGPEKLSTDRAHSVLNVLKQRCGVTKGYDVGMGASTMYEGKSTTKNRLVEVWVAFP